VLYCVVSVCIVLCYKDKFAVLSLSFKTDRQTLDKRAELHKRARDTAEENITKEMEGLKAALKVFKLSAIDRTD